MVGERWLGRAYVGGRSESDWVVVVGVGGRKTQAEAYATGGEPLVTCREVI